MKLSIWLHFGSVVVASVTAAVFISQLSTVVLQSYGSHPPTPLGRFVASSQLWPLFLPVPWLIAGIRLSRRAEISQASLHIFSASCCFVAVCIVASVLLVYLFLFR